MQRCVLSVRNVAVWDEAPLNFSEKTGFTLKDADSDSILVLKLK